MVERSEKLQWGGGVRGFDYQGFNHFKTVLETAVVVQITIKPVCLAGRGGVALTF